MVIGPTAPHDTLLAKLQCTLRQVDPARVSHAQKLLDANRGREGVLFQRLELEYSTVIPSLFDALVHFYIAFNPKKTAEIPAVLQAWSGAEGQLISALHEKYDTTFFNTHCPELVARLRGNQKKPSPSAPQRRPKRRGPSPHEEVDPVRKQVVGMFSVHAPHRAKQVDALLRRYKGGKALLATLVDCWGTPPKVHIHHHQRYASPSPPKPDNQPSPSPHHAEVSYRLAQFYMDHAPDKLHRVPEVLRMWDHESAHLLDALERSPPADSPKTPAKLCSSPAEVSPLSEVNGGGTISPRTLELVAERRRADALMKESEELRGKLREVTERCARLEEEALSRKATPPKPSEPYVCVTTGAKHNVREAAALDAPRIGKIPRGTVVNVKELKTTDSGVWVKLDVG
eukprot:Sspe_Gene.69622::Locus_41052_Transcript_1_1_Confidence_1.000_Length_1257::g.69622::m.69622